MDGGICMMEHKFNWDKARSSDEDRKEELTRFRERNGIVFSKPDYQEYRYSDENLRRYESELHQGKKTKTGENVLSGRTRGCCAK